MLRYEHDVDDECHYSSRNEYNVYHFNDDYKHVYDINIRNSYDHDWNLNINYSNNDDCHFV